MSHHSSVSRVKIVFIWSDEFAYWISTSHYILNLRYRSPHAAYAIFSYPLKKSQCVTKLWIHRRVTLFTICIYLCLLNIYTKINLSTVFQSWDMDPSLWILKHALKVIKPLKRDNINNLCLCLNRNKILCS